VDGLVEVGRGGGLETPEALRFLVELYEEVKVDLGKTLAQRIQDRKFIDERVRACFEFNRDMGRDFLSQDYKTVIGLEDARGRVVFGAHRSDFASEGGAQIAPLPEFLKGPHVTLFRSAGFGENGDQRHECLSSQAPKGARPSSRNCLDLSSPMWGADDEDSKTPLRSDLVDAATNSRDVSHKSSSKRATSLTR